MAAAAVALTPSYEEALLSTSTIKKDEEHANTDIKNICLETEKKQKSSSISFEMFKKDVSISNICKIRNLKEETIICHIIQYIPDESITYQRFMTDDEFQLIKQQLELQPSTNTNTDIKNKLPNEISYNKIRIARRLISTQ